MAFYRIYPSKDTSIANLDPTSVGMKAIGNYNVGASEILNLYKTSISTSASAHVLIQFDLTSIPPAALAAGPEFRLKLFDAQHAESLPTEYSAVIYQVSHSWQEGQGHDMDYYTDAGYANWFSASVSASWSQAGGDVAADHNLLFGSPFPVPFFGTISSSYYFYTGHENLDADVFVHVEDWIDHGGNYGFFIQIDPSLPNGTDYYIKKFHSRHTHFVTKKPYLEVRWEDWTGSLSTSSFVMGNSGTYSGTLLPAWTSLPHSTASILNSITDHTGVLVSSLPDLKQVYDAFESPRLHLYARPKDWNPATVAAAISDSTGSVLMDAYYRVVNERTEEVLVPYATGSIKYTKLSWNDAGNYFDINMSSLPTGTLMRFDFIYNISGTWTEIHGDEFTFRIR